ncbi:hypothetical protein Hte_006869 [Hypoxylon texense]
MAYDAQHNDVPRSLVVALEDEIAALETKIGQLQGGSPETHHNVSAYTSASLLDLQRHDHVLETLLERVGVMDTSLCPSRYHDMQKTISTVRNAFHLQPSDLPLPLGKDARHTQETRRPGADAPQTLVSFSQIPKSAADLLIRNYTEIHLPQYPCLSETDLLESFGRCFDGGGQASAFDSFTVSLAMAISSNTMLWRSEEGALSSSARLWATAHTLLGHPDLFSSAQQQLQADLLVIHYAFTNPTVADVWYLIGEAMRLCVQLNYHREPVEGHLNYLDLDTRRRLFWTACSMEMLTYSSLADYCIRPDGLFIGPHKKASALHMLECRHLETEIYRRLYLPRYGDTSQSLQEWIADMTEKLDAWHRKAETFALEQKLEFRNIQFYFQKCRLHRPAPNNRNPPLASRLVTIECAKLLAEQYTGLRLGGRLFYPWHGGHILFEAGIVLLDAALSAVQWSSGQEDVQNAIQVISDYPSALRSVSELWPALDICVEVFVQLSQPVVRFLREIQCQKFLGLELPASPICPELEKYLFPAPALENYLGLDGSSLRPGGGNGCQ